MPRKSTGQQVARGAMKKDRESLIRHARNVHKLQHQMCQAVEDTRRVAEKVFEGE